MASLVIFIKGGQTDEAGEVSIKFDASARNDQNVGFNLQDEIFDVTISQSKPQMISALVDGVIAWIVSIGGPSVPANQVVVFGG